MGLGGLVRRAAAGAPVPTFVAAGRGGRDPVRGLVLRPELELVTTPRHATVLLVAGAVDASGAEALARIHDQLPHPRAALWWDVGAGSAPMSTATAVTGTEADVVAALRTTHAAIVTGQRPSSEPLLRDEPPNPWQGVGPYGQGGKGMTGGTPYGRPMTGRAADRDGLELDQLTVTFGPWAWPLPPGLVLTVKVQGDVVQEAHVEPTPVGGAHSSADPFARARREPVSVTEVELARARHHLAWAADVLRVVGLAAESRRVLRTAMALRAPAPDAAALDAAERAARALASTRRLRAPMAGVGHLHADDVRALGGPNARASGIADDARTSDPAYRDLGFEPVVEPGGDAWARWRVRLREAAQSVVLARTAGDAMVSPAALEPPRGLQDRGAVARIVTGLEWGDAVVALASVDVDPTELPGADARGEDAA